jgi:hypothetical protein
MKIVLTAFQYITTQLEGNQLEIYWIKQHQSIVTLMTTDIHIETSPMYEKGAAGKSMHIT